ncbi:MAG: N-acetyltransferase [Promethearchaeota archaeon]|nr:MAG: N-acetyltransferase [Candidatus Lokiarchaeota archaeon]
MTEFCILNLNTDINNYYFDSGVEELNDFFLNLSQHYIKESLSQVYYLKEEDNNKVIGYFAISCGDIEFRRTLNIKKKISHIPCVLIGRLAIDKEYQRKGFGTELLKLALNISISLSNKIGCRLVN